MSPGWSVEGLEVDVEGFHLGPVDLAIAPGSAVAVLGASGAGKTTLLRTLAGFVPARRGRILRDGVDLTRSLPEERALGYLPQGLGLFPHRTVERNVRYPLEIRARGDAAARSRELLERFRLTPLARRYPSRLSGGEQQRVAIARALAAEPELVVLDEPWQGLDVLARHELGAVLHDVRATEKVPIVVVTHDPALAFSIADSFLVLDRGVARPQCDATTLLDAPADAFAARFVGFENVFDAEALGAGTGGSLRRWLLDRSGSAGIAFGTPSFPAGASDRPLWEGRVRSVRPGPHGLTIEATADELLVTLRLPPPVTAPLPTLGATLAFGIDPGTVRALGEGPRAACRP